LCILQNSPHYPRRMDLPNSKPAELFFSLLMNSSPRLQSLMISRGTLESANNNNNATKGRVIHFLLLQCCCDRIEPWSIVRTGDHVVSYTEFICSYMTAHPRFHPKLNVELGNGGWGKQLFNTWTWTSQTFVFVIQEKSVLLLYWGIWLLRFENIFKA